MRAECMAQLLSCLGKRKNVQKRLESRSADDFTTATITLMRAPRPVSGTWLDLTQTHKLGRLHPARLKITRRSTNEDCKSSGGSSNAIAFSLMN